MRTEEAAVGKIAKRGENVTGRGETRKRRYVGGGSPKESGFRGASLQTQLRYIEWGSVAGKRPFKERTKEVSKGLSGG